MDSSEPTTQAPNDHRKFMERAIELARCCKTEPGRSDPSPKVGAVLVRNGEILGGAYRGEDGPGDHAEFILLQKKLQDEIVAGTTLYTTLEPCTHRSETKTPCADRIIDRRIKKVFIGAVDPDGRIRGKGLMKLQESGIQIQLFPDELSCQILDLDREFRRHRKKQSDKQPGHAQSAMLPGLRDMLARMRTDLPIKKLAMTPEIYKRHLHTVFVAAGNALQRARDLHVLDEYVDLLVILDGVDHREYAWQSDNMASDRFRGFWFWIKATDDPGFDERGDYQPYALMRLEEIIDRAIDS